MSRSLFELLGIVKELKAVVPDDLNTLSLPNKLKVVRKLTEILVKHKITIEEINDILDNVSPMLSIWGFLDK